MSELFAKDRLSENDENHSPDNPQTLSIGSYRTNSFFELYNNQHCIKNDLTRKPRTTDSSFNRSEEDEESNLNDDDLNFDDLDDLGRDPRGSNVVDELSNSEEDDKFDEDQNETDEIGIPINRFRRPRSNSRTLHEDEISGSFKQYAKSLPISIPNFKPFGANSRKLHDENDDLDWFSVKDNPENIAESIKALAKSVRDDGYELFGDLPRRFNTSEIIRDRPI